jgi:hypothetical protein
MINRQNCEFVSHVGEIKKGAIAPSKRYIAEEAISVSDSGNSEIKSFSCISDEDVVVENKSFSGDYSTEVI